MEDALVCTYAIAVNIWDGGRLSDHIFSPWVVVDCFFFLFCGFALVFFVFIFFRRKQSEICCWWGEVRSEWLDKKQSF